VHLQEEVDRKRDNMLKSIQKMEQAARGNKKDHQRLKQVTQKVLYEEKIVGTNTVLQKAKYNKIGAEKTEDGRKWVTQHEGVGYRPGSINEVCGCH
jgi:hypothetical protein